MAQSGIPGSIGLKGGKKTDKQPRERGDQLKSTGDPFSDSVDQ